MSKHRGRATRKKNLPKSAVYALAEKCYAQTRGLPLYSPEESDRYYEFAEAVMQLVARAKNQQLPRTAPER